MVVISMLKRLFGRTDGLTHEAHQESARDLLEAAASKRRAATQLREVGAADLAARKERDAEMLRQLADELDMLEG